MEIKRVERKLMETAERYPRYPRYFESVPLESKVVFLNKENLEKLEGYKATVELKSGVLGKVEIHIVLTGFSMRPGGQLYDSLKALNQKEIYGE